ncbi:MAG: hypothetical protein GXP37_05275 [Chloroflexi bacterium]|nr:hypothetical protein [Chloroflexota bacterium]
MTEKTDPLGPSYSLFSDWQGGDTGARHQLRALFDAAIAGKFDTRFAEKASPDIVSVTTSLHLLTLSILHQLVGMNSAEFYKGDPVRYVRTTLLTQRLLGIRKLTLGWPAYAFAAEALGQAMLYPEGHAPGADPAKPMANMENWRQLHAPEFTSGIPHIIEEMLACFADLTGLEPVAHLPAPYSLAADIFGQEALITTLVQTPDFVQPFLDHLTDHILTPWIERLVHRLPHVWIELSDASGSPLFIGPRRCKTVAVPPVYRLIANEPWGRRVFVANYRGDHHALPSQGGKRRARRERVHRPASEVSAKSRGEDAAAQALNDLMDFKLSVCPEFIIKLEADQLPIAVYVEQAIRRAKALYLGIGATRIDRGSITDSSAAAQDIHQLAADYAQAIKAVSTALAQRAKPRSVLAWPGDVTIEDINAESDFSLVRTIVETVAQNG